MEYKYSVVMGPKYFASAPNQEYTKEFLSKFEKRIWLYMMERLVML